MSPTSRNPLEVLRGRGYVHDVSDDRGLARLLATERVTFYVGFDPTAPSLHIGHLMGILVMARLQRMGHRPIAVAGGGTGRIGDPTDRDTERELLDDAQLARNLVGIREQLDRIIDLSTADGGILVDNHDWLGGLGFIEFIRDVGKHFSVNSMIARESVKRRLAQRDRGISFTEFSYQLLQAYDFAHLYATEGCRLQAGGSDQWGNITAGIDLTRRLHGAQVFGLVWPLVERSDGRKFSKSTGEAVWLDPEMTSPYAFYQWFVNLPDADVAGFLRRYTFLELDEINEIVGRHQMEPGSRIAQRALAEEVTRIVHGAEGLAAAERATEILFGNEPFAGLDDRTLADAFESAPSTTLPSERLAEGIGIIALLVETGAASSNSEARRLITQGGVRVNNRKIDDLEHRLGPDDLAGATTLVLRIGKKRYHLARFT